MCGEITSQSGGPQRRSDHEDSLAEQTAQESTHSCSSADCLGLGNHDDTLVWGPGRSSADYSYATHEPEAQTGSGKEIRQPYDTNNEHAAESLPALDLTGDTADFLSDTGCPRLARAPWMRS